MSVKKKLSGIKEELFTPQMRGGYQVLDNALKTTPKNDDKDRIEVNLISWKVYQGVV